MDDGKIVSNGETTPEAKAVKYVLSDETWEVSTDRTYHRIVAVKDFVRSDGVKVHARQRHAIALHDRVEQIEVQLRHNIKALVAGLVLIGADHAHGVPLRTQIPDEVHAGNGGAVVLFAQNIADNRNRHCVVSFLAFFRIGRGVPAAGCDAHHCNRQK